MIKALLQRLTHKKTYGTLSIPLVSIFVPLFEGKDLQKIVDERMSAVIFDYGKTKVIADHCHQNNFSNLNAVEINALAIIYHDGKTKLYRCFGTEVGHLLLGNGTKLRDADWNYIHNRNADLCIYTCIKKSSETIMDIRLTFWKEV